MLVFRFDLSAIRNAAAALFVRWDEELEGGRPETAKRIRQRELWPLVRGRLTHEATAFPGIYAFIDNTARPGWEGITYIGQSSGTLNDRLDDYIKDDSCWDASLLNEQADVSDVSLRRLRLVMPSTDATLHKHTLKHAASVRKTRGCSLFVAGFEPEEAELITPTEAALIAVAWCGGAPLENDKIERLPGPHQRSSIIGVCEAIIRAWRDCGLNEQLAREAETSLRRARSVELQ